MLTEFQIETIVAETCGTYRTGDSYTFEDVWNCIEKALAAHSAGAQEPVAWMYQSEDPFDGGEWFLSDTKPNRRNIRPLYSHPQPITDAASGRGR